MPRYLLSPEAQRSLVQISEYTLNNYGRQQQKSYLKMLREHMRAVARRPEKGRDRCEIKTGYCSIQAEKHRIYYRIRESHIEIIDVLHQSMEPKTHIG